MTPQEPLNTQIEAMTPGQEGEILALQNRVLRTSRDLDYWRWKVELNPYSHGHTVVSRSTQDGSLLGSYTVVPLYLSLAGKKVKAGQPSDTVVDSQSRRNGIFTNLFVAITGRCQSNNVQLLFGFPNAAALPANIASTEAHPVCYLHCYEQWFDLMKPLEAAGIFPLLAASINLILNTITRLKLQLVLFVLKLIHPAQLTIERTKTAPQTYDGLWKRISTRNVLSIWKDKEYITWRYDLHPHNQHFYYSAYANGILVAVLVIADINKHYFVTEILLAERHVGRAKILLIESILDALKNSGTHMSFYGRDSGLFDAIFAGIMPRNPAQEFMLVLRQIGDDQSLKRCAFNPESWCISTGDLDFTY